MLKNGLTRLSNKFRITTKDLDPKDLHGLAAWYRADQGIPATIDPSTISGLVARYRADQGITTATGVSQWNDMVGGDANKNLTQANGSQQPTLIVSDPAYNNQPTLSFSNAANTYLVSGTWSAPLAQPFTEVVIGNCNSSASPRIAVDGLLSQVSTQDSNGTAQLYAGLATIGAHTGFGSPNVVAGVFNGGSSQMYVESNTVTDTGSPGTNGRTGVTVGGLYNHSATNAWDGKIAEVLIFNRVLTNQEIVNINQYAANRYGIAIPHIISQWNDQSGTGDANKNAAQATITLQPTYVASSASYNGKPVLNFTTGSQLLQSTAWTTPLSHSTIFVVGNDDGILGSNEYFMDGLVSNSQLFQAYQNKYQIYAGAPVQATVTQTNTPKVFCGAFNGASSALYINSFSPSLTGNAGAAQMTGITIGNNSGGGFGLKGNIAEIIVYNRVLTADEITQVTLYLSSRYNITVANAPQLVGLSAWYRSTDNIVLNGSTVSAWDDLSGSGDANKKLVQNTGSAQPAYIASDPQYNGIPTLSFVSGNSQNLVSGTWATSLPSPRTVIAVGDFRGADANPYWIDGLTLNTNAIGTNVGAGNHRAVIYAGSYLTDPLPAVTNTPSIIAAVINGASSSLFDGYKTAVATGNAGSATMTGLILGGISTAYYTGHTAEILAYNRVLSQDEINVVIDYLRNRYFPTPKLPGLVAWYRADQNITLNGSTVSAWGDASNFGDANRNLAQNTAANQPTFVSSNASFNGASTLHFTGSQWLNSGTWSTALAQPSTIIAIANQSAPDLVNDRLCVDGIDGANRQSLLTEAGVGSKYASYAGVAPQPVGAATTSPVVFAATFNGASSQLWLSAKTPITASPGTASLAGLTIGARYLGTPAAGGAFWNGDVAEVMVFNRALSQEEINLVLAYAGNRYGIVVGA